MTTRRILVTGSRKWGDVHRIRSVLAYHRVAFPDAILVHGNARGADRIAAQIWKSWGLPTEAHPVTNTEWAVNRGAGHARNRRMIEAGADICLAFIRNNSPGSTHCARWAMDAGIPTYLHVHTDS
ncbi:SLOG family protein [Kibdelosporangium aridum]|uniref:YspA cpYpsA-related SLOG domain-containing protein n=1 Tax=Kibdelosporangium aridum TaxID=2030 RepID=A0A1W2EWX9_KIBAR|nr:SLOG family protein [Kibdelosporangium aridum]SMD14204.1 Protein of unknown function [Kibdelosporangium aridum]